MKKVKFIIYSYENSIEKTKLIDENESLREQIIEIVNGYVSNTPEEDIKPYFHKLREDFPLEITLEEAVLHQSYSSHFYVTENKKIVFMTFYESLGKDWTISEFQTLISSGYMEGNTNTIYVSIPSGLGGGWEPDYNLTILTTVSKMILPFLGKHFFKKIKKIFFMRKMKRVAKIWVEKHGVRGAKQIREFIDRKGEWQTEKLKDALDIDEETAVLFLTSLGYELKQDLWKKSYSDSAIEFRKKWEEYSEKNYLY